MPEIKGGITLGKNMTEGDRNKLEKAIGPIKRMYEVKWHKGKAPEGWKEGEVIKNRPDTKIVGGVLPEPEPINVEWTASKLKALNKEEQIEMLGGLGEKSIPKTEKGRVKVLMKLLGAE